MIGWLRRMLGVEALEAELVTVRQELGRALHKADSAKALATEAHQGAYQLAQRVRGETAAIRRLRWEHEALIEEYAESKGSHQYAIVLRRLAERTQRRLDAFNVQVDEARARAEGVAPPQPPETTSEATSKGVTEPVTEAVTDGAAPPATETVTS